MKYIFLNLKRFDVPVSLGGVNRNSILDWAPQIIVGINKIDKYEETEFAAFFPEAYLMKAIETVKQCGSPMQIGCQGVFKTDVETGKNFGAFTTNRPAKAMKALGTEYTIIGHCEERKDKLEIMSEAGCADRSAVNRILNQEIKCALNAGLKVLYCIGETAEEQADKFTILREQLSVGLEGVDHSSVVIAYEPVWAIGPGKTPPNETYISEIAQFVKQECDNIPVVYGGGLKTENAKMLAGIPEIDGGLIALTRFSGEIGFYADEFLDIVNLYLNA